MARKGYKLKKWTSPRYLISIKYPVVTHKCFECNCYSLDWKIKRFIKIGLQKHKKWQSPIEQFYDSTLSSYYDNQVSQLLKVNLLYGSGIAKTEYKSIKFKGYPKIKL